MKNIIYGFIIGICKILPGISGGIMAVSLGVYNKAIMALNDLENKNNIIYIFKLLIGFIIGVILSSKILLFLFVRYSKYLLPLFVGVIIYSVSDIYKKINKMNMVLLLIGFFMVILMNLINFVGNIKESIFLYFMMGLIESLSTIIPGISGMALFSILGVYERILSMLSSIMHLTNIMANMAFWIPFVIGFIIMSLVLIKLVNSILKKYENKYYSFILGIVLGTVLILLKKIICADAIVYLMLISGIVLGYYLNKIN